MLPFFKKRVLGISPKPVAVPVVATAFASPVPLLGRDASGRNVKKVVDTSTVFNQFEQLKKFQHINSTPDKVFEEKIPSISSKRQSAKVPWLLLIVVAIVSSITASVVILTYTSLHVPSYDTRGPASPLNPDVNRDTFSEARRHRTVPTVNSGGDLSRAMITSPETLPPYAKVYKVIHVRKADVLFDNGESDQLLIDHDRTAQQAPNGLKVRAKRSALKIFKAVTEIFKVPIELRHEIDFNFH